MIAVTRNSEYRFETNEDEVTTLWRVKNLMETDHPNIAVGDTRQGQLVNPIQVGRPILLAKKGGGIFITSTVTEIRK